MTVREVDYLFSDLLTKLIDSTYLDFTPQSWFTHDLALNYIH